MSVKRNYGRGQKAPYQTQTMRVPVALIPVFERMKASYVERVESGDLHGEDASTFLQEAVMRVLEDEAVTRKKKTRVP